MSNENLHELIRAAVHQAERHLPNGPLGHMAQNRERFTEHERREIESLLHWGQAMADLLRRTNPEAFAAETTGEDDSNG